MRKETESAEVLQLPYRLATSDELRDCDDIEIWSYQLRAHAVEQIRLIQTGMLDKQIIENMMNNLKGINILLAEFGKSTLSLDFLD